jgi:GTP cyclohydrolase IA
MRAILESQSLAGTGLQELMREMLVRLGEDPERDGLRDTPQRMERSKGVGHFNASDSVF